MTFVSSLFFRHKKVMNFFILVSGSLRCTWQKPNSNLLRQKGNVSWLIIQGRQGWLDPWHRWNLEPKYFSDGPSQSCCSSTWEESHLLLLWNYLLFRVGDDRGKEVKLSQSPWFQLKNPREEFSLAWFVSHAYLCYDDGSQAVEPCHWTYLV